MGRITSEQLVALEVRKHALRAAIGRGCSDKWLLRLWSRFIKARDGFRCLCCESTEQIQAHHIIRKTLYPWSALDLGNGITLCRACHKRVHAEFNRRPDVSLPLGAEQGDDQDEWAFLFGSLVDDAQSRGLPENEFYFLSDCVLEFSFKCQGYKDLYGSVMRNERSRISFAHEIWRMMPENFYTTVVSEFVRLDFDSFDG
jgi:hypothetical protein